MTLRRGFKSHGSRKSGDSRPTTQRSSLSLPNLKYPLCARALSNYTWGPANPIRRDTWHELLWCGLIQEPLMQREIAA
jgi:hypothetical protein